MTKKLKPIDKKKPGRPSSYRPEYCQELIDHMSEGYSYDTFAATIDVCKDTLYEWESVHPEFSDAKRIARQKQLKANEKRMHDLATGKIRNGNVTAQIFIMKNCHKWTDRLETTERRPSEKTDAELLADVKRLLKEIEEE